MHVSSTDRSLLKFNLASIPAGSVTNAQLKLCFASFLSLAIGRTHQIVRPTAPWAETTVTWSNQPGGNSGTAITWNVPLLVTDCVTLDVTATVQAWAGSASNFGWRITDADEATAPLVEYETRESTNASRRPTLDVTYTPP
jgi:hypothetical protein